MCNYAMDNNLKKEIIKKVLKLKKNYHQGEIPILSKHEVHPELSISSRLNYLYFTLPVCINYQRNSQAMWKSALKTFHDNATSYLFYPEKIINYSFSKIQKDICKYNLALQKNRHTKIWIKISETLFKYFDADPRKIIQETGNDVVKIKKLISKTMKKSFPYLSGPKMSNYWLFILLQYTDIKLKNLSKVSIIPDTHVIQATDHLGIDTKKLSRNDIEEIWFDLLSETDILPIELHPVLWHWSRNNFMPKI